MYSVFSFFLFYLEDVFAPNYDWGGEEWDKGATWLVWKDLAGLMLNIIEKTVFLGTPGHNISWSDSVGVHYQMMNAVDQVSPV